MRTKPELGWDLRSVLSVLLAGVTLAGAVFLGSAHLKMHGHYHCAPSPVSPAVCDPASSYWLVGRFVWQIPVAIVVGVAGLAAAFAVAKRS